MGAVQVPVRIVELVMMIFSFASVVRLLLLWLWMLSSGCWLLEGIRWPVAWLVDRTAEALRWLGL